MRAWAALRALTPAPAPGAGRRPPAPRPGPRPGGRAPGGKRRDEAWHAPFAGPCGPAPPSGGGGGPWTPRGDRDDLLVGLRAEPDRGVVVAAAVGPALAVAGAAADGRHVLVGLGEGAAGGVGVAPAARDRVTVGVGAAADGRHRLAGVAAEAQGGVAVVAAVGVRHR